MVLALFTVIAVLLAIFASPLLGVVILAVGCVLYFSIGSGAATAWGPTETAELHSLYGVGGGGSGDSSTSG